MWAMVGMGIFTGEAVASTGERTIDSEEDWGVGGRIWGTGRRVLLPGSLNGSDSLRADDAWVVPGSELWAREPSWNGSTATELPGADTKRLFPAGLGGGGGGGAGLFGGGGPGDAAPIADTPDGVHESLDRGDDERTDSCCCPGEAEAEA